MPHAQNTHLESIGEDGQYICNIRIHWNQPGDEEGCDVPTISPCKTTTLSQSEIYPKSVLQAPPYPPKVNCPNSPLSKLLHPPNMKVILKTPFLGPSHPFKVEILKKNNPFKTSPPTQIALSPQRPKNECAKQSLPKFQQQVAFSRPSSK